MPEELASAWVPLNANRPLRQYFNRVVSARARQAQEQANADELQARLERLRAFFDKHHAEAWVPVADLPAMEDAFFEDHFHMLDHFLGLTQVAASATQGAHSM